MKKFKPILLLTALLAVVFIFSSCKKPEDKREKFLGAYNVDYEVLVGSYYKGTFTIDISKGSADNSIVLSRASIFYSGAVRATIDGNYFNIPQQSVQTGQISGSGSIDGRTLRFETVETETGMETYTVRFNGYKM
jgi:hypothetical protein